MKAKPLNLFNDMIPSMAANTIFYQHGFKQFQTGEKFCPLETVREKITALSHIIYGKRILHKIRMGYKHKDEIVYALARRIRENDAISEELTQKVQSFIPDVPNV